MRGAKAKSNDIAAVALTFISDLVYNVIYIHVQSLVYYNSIWT